MAKCSLCGKEITRGYPVCPDCYSGYFVADKLQEQKLPDKPMTRGDKFRSMTNEEVAELLSNNKKEYREILDWLNAPAE